MGESCMYPRCGKRLLDLVFTIPAVILLSPMLVLMAFLVRLKLGSPVIFRQQRPGLHGQPFTLFKFRTMTNARDAQGNLLSDADRLAVFGRFLRSTSLDERNLAWQQSHGPRNHLVTRSTGSPGRAHRPTARGCAGCHRNSSYASANHPNQAAQTAAAQSTGVLAVARKPVPCILPGGVH